MFLMSSLPRHIQILVFILGPEQEAEIRCVPRARMIQRGPSPGLARTHTNAPQSANISLCSGWVVGPCYFHEGIEEVMQGKGFSAFDC